MKILISNIRLPLSIEKDELMNISAKRAGLHIENVKNFRIIKESIDARRKPDISRVYSVLLDIGNSHKVKNDADIKLIDEIKEVALEYGTKRMHTRPVVVGSGPAGIFAGLLLAQHGFKPIIYERGEAIEERTIAVDKHWASGILDTETNVQFGEGGAGTFSDGKLTTRINDSRCDRVLKEFHNFGAHEDILYKAKPHIGSDVLKNVVINIRRKIEELGGEVRFRSKMTNLEIENGKLKGITINNSEQVDADILILAIGHSARDTFQCLLNKGVSIERKPFSIGVRVEHPQTMINKSQYGNACSHPALGPADYQLFQKVGNRTAYSFCMCPGGVVVASASEDGMIVTNGMSEFARDKENANSAFVVSVEPSDFGGTHPLSGVEFQRFWERKAYAAGGMNGSAPVQKLQDFVEGAVSNNFLHVKPSYTGPYKSADLNNCLPDFVASSMKEAIGVFNLRMKGFAYKEAVLTGVETRTSSPVRILRGETLEALGVEGLYPTGEGAGYAGGIMSAAVDGIRAAEQIIKTYSPLL